MRNIIITADGLEHRYVANHLSEILKSTLMGVVLERPTIESSFIKRLNDIKKKYGYLRILERTMTKTVRRMLKIKYRQETALKKILGQPSIDFAIDCPFVSFFSANSSKAIEWIKDIKPDYIFIYGTGFINKNLLSIPSGGSLNLHTGLSPYYRGSDTFFWPLFNKEPKLVGSTVHECTPDIDGGDIYGRISVKLDENDDQYTAFAKCVKEGTKLYTHIANKLICGEKLEKIKQNFSYGKEYRFKDLNFVHELRMEYRIKSGSLGRLLLENKNEKLPYTFRY